jgi:hypothetical protein
MYLISQQQMSEKLAKSWKFLGGVDLTFSLSSKAISGDGRHTHRVVLPVTLEDPQASRAMAISLIIHETEAKRVSAHMFGLNQNEVTEDDIKDACKEACNVLGGGLIMDPNSKLGIPFEVSEEDFLKLQKDSTLNVTFASNQPFADLIILSILDVSNQPWSLV